MAGADITLATIATTNPLEVLADTATKPAPARLVRGTSYTPTTQDRVLVLTLGRTVYILGGA